MDAGDDQAGRREERQGAGDQAADWDTRLHHHRAAEAAGVAGRGAMFPMWVPVGVGRGAQHAHRRGLRAQLTRARAEEFYGEHYGKPFFPRLVEFMTSGPIWALVLARPGAIKAWRELMGPTNVFTARAEKPRWWVVTCLEFGLGPAW
jgi:hypothetical protein